MPEQVQLISECDLPTKWGEFQCAIFRKETEEIMVISKGEIKGTEHLFTRLHSACFTGEALSSLKCDCQEQLNLSLQKINELGEGAVLYLQQEGRGIGLANKLRAYKVQKERNLDTEEANLYLGFKNDLRDYTFATEVLKKLNIKSVHLNTNNPLKVASLEKAGITVSKQIGSITTPNSHNLQYLKTKLEKHGHTCLGQVLN